MSNYSLRASGAIILTIMTSICAVVTGSDMWKSERRLSWNKRKKML